MLKAESDWDRSKISRIETGERGIRAKELRELLTEYGVPATEQDLSKQHALSMQAWHGLRNVHAALASAALGRYSPPAGTSPRSAATACRDARASRSGSRRK